MLEPDICGALLYRRAAADILHTAYVMTNYSFLSSICMGGGSCSLLRDRFVGSRSLTWGVVCVCSFSLIRRRQQ